MLKLANTTLSGPGNFSGQLGVEFSDDWSFFTFEEHKRHKATVFDRGDMHIVTLHTGTVELLHTLRTNDSSIVRTDHLRTRTSVQLLDFVSRYVFPKQLFTMAQINNLTVYHQNANIYHQHPASSCTLLGPNHTVTITIDSWQGKGFTPYLYVRDEPGNWVVHVRLLPTTEAHHPIVLKYNTRWYNRALPGWLQAIIPAWVKHKLLYLGERKRYWSFFGKLLYRLFPFSSYRLVHLSPGEDISLESTLLVKES